MDQHEKVEKVTNSVYWWMVGFICGIFFTTVCFVFGGSITLRVQLIEPIPAVEAGK